jgi:hypothetical protein
LHVQILNANAPKAFGKRGRCLVRQILANIGNACMQLRQAAFGLAALREPRFLRDRARLMATILFHLVQNRTD